MFKVYNEVFYQLAKYMTPENVNNVKYHDSKVCQILSFLYSQRLQGIYFLDFGKKKKSYV
jgi:hypothetical protein